MSRNKFMNKKHYINRIRNQDIEFLQFKNKLLGALEGNIFSKNKLNEILLDKRLKNPFDNLFIALKRIKIICK